MENEGRMNSCVCLPGQGVIVRPPCIHHHDSSSEGSVSGNQPYSLKSTMSSPMAFEVTRTPSARRASAWFRAPEGWDLGEMMPLALMTLCQGTLALWCGEVEEGSVGRCFRQRPTCLGRWAGVVSGWRRRVLC